MYQNNMSYLSIVLLLILTLSQSIVFIVLPQESDFAVQITKPNEGETFYAGPSTLMYVIEITGWVTGADDPSAVQVQLEVIQESKVISGLVSTPLPDGSYSFPVTVNPEGSDGNFTLVQISAGCDRCHYRASLDLPPRNVVLRVTARDPNGYEAIAERNIIVELSSFATIPIQVFDVDFPNQPVPNIYIRGSTWIFNWRARHFSSQTDEDGTAYMKVEALSESPTHYLFTVEPTMIDGSLYKGFQPFELTLPPGATSAPPIKLYVRQQMEIITGKLGDLGGRRLPPLGVWAINIKNGSTYQTNTDVRGNFEFRDLPFAQYVITTDAWELAQHHFSSGSQIIDLPQSKDRTILLSMESIKGLTVKGTLFEEGAGQLPFAQVSVEETGQTQRTLPSDGTWYFTELPIKPISISIVVPGYYSQKVVLSLSSITQNKPFELSLQRRPETRKLPWGEGEVIIPPESQAQIEHGTISLDNGWIWGSGGGEEPLHILTAMVEIIMKEGTFALENLNGHDPWLYVKDGLSSVRRLGDETHIDVLGGKMIALTSEDHLMPVPLNPVVDASIHTDTELPISPVWKQSLDTQIKSNIAKFGINFAQIITYITYIFIFLILALTPALAIRWWRKRS